MSMKFLACGIALAAGLVSPAAALAQVTGTPMVIWSKPSGRDEAASETARLTPRGPSAHQLAIALTDPSGSPKPRVRELACGVDNRDPALFDCAYEQQDATGAWKRWSARVTDDHNHWRLIDAPALGS
jgi:hypothetical protein